MHSYRSSSHDQNQRIVARAWRENAKKLARWVRAHLVVRIDRFGTQKRQADCSFVRTTAWSLTHDDIIRHFEAGIDSSPDQIIGVHCTSSDEFCRWGAIDIDRHNDESATDNFRFALRVLKRARRAGLSAVLIDSNGDGGFHIWVLFSEAIPMSDARRLMLWLSRNWKEFGLPKPPDLFPSNDHLSGQRCGAWLRLPGRHHKRPSWSRVWCTRARTWLSGEAAIHALLSLRGKSVDVDAIVPASLGRTARKSRPPRRTQYFSGASDDEERDLALARDALRFYPNNDLHYDEWLEILMSLRQLDEPGRDLCHEWSQESSKYDGDDLDRRWDSFKEGGEYPYDSGHWITIATLLKRAKDAGWPGPFALGLHYPVDFRERPGPVYIVRGRAAFRALEARGHMVIGTPDRDEPCLYKVGRLLYGDGRLLIVVGSREPYVDPVPVARFLQTELDKAVLTRWPPEPYDNVAAWLEATDRQGRDREEGRSS